MSQLGPTSAVSGFLRHGCSTPETGHWLARLARQKSARSRHNAAQQTTNLLDHLVGGYEQAGWHCEAKRLGGLEIDHEFKLGGLLDR